MQILWNARKVLSKIIYQLWPSVCVESSQHTHCRIRNETDWRFVFNRFQSLCKQGLIISRSDGTGRRLAVLQRRTETRNGGNCDLRYVSAFVKFLQCHMVVTLKPIHVIIQKFYKSCHVYVLCAVRIAHLLVDNQVCCVHAIRHTLTLTRRQPAISVIDVWHMQQNLLDMTVSKVIIYPSNVFQFLLSSKL